LMGKLVSDIGLGRELTVGRNRRKIGANILKNAKTAVKMRIALTPNGRRIHVKLSTRTNPELR